MNNNRVLGGHMIWAVAGMYLIYLGVTIFYDNRADLSANPWYIYAGAVLFLIAGIFLFILSTKRYVDDRKKFREEEASSRETEISYTTIKDRARINMANSPEDSGFFGENDDETFK